MKDGICPLCRSSEVYMTENKDNLRASDNELKFNADEGRNTVYYGFNTYVCLNCGYTAMFAKVVRYSTKDNPGLAFLKSAKGWKKAA
jgi:predicted nucleic-acid-binding Zn-ribbon protein